MAPRRRRLLLTGFGPFPGAPVNPTEAVVARLAASGRDLGIDIVPHVFPTTWAAVAAVGEVVAQAAPDVVLHLGLARSARAITVETRARNLAAPWTVDAAGRAPPTAALHGDGPPARPVELPVRRIAARIAATGLPVRLSGDAGRYLCNGLLWHSLALHPKRPTGFLHLPPTRALRHDRTAPAFDLPDLERAVAAAIGVLV